LSIPKLLLLPTIIHYHNRLGREILIEATSINEPIVEVVDSM
jgi:hypothetical protein